MSDQQAAKTDHEVLSSEMVVLRTEGSTTSFNVHKALLETKCKVVHSALTTGFSETVDKVYIFKDTTDTTLARFAEWAYRGDYRDNLGKFGKFKVLIEPQAENEWDVSTDNETEVDGERSLDIENSPLMAHLRLYIFSNIYFVKKLKKLEFKRLTNLLAHLDKPADSGEKLTVVAVLRVAFTELPPDDKLLAWLAHYASYSINRLRGVRSFIWLLREVPFLAFSMTSTVGPACDSPWQTGKEKKVYADQVYAEQVQAEQVQAEEPSNWEEPDIFTW